MQCYICLESDNLINPCECSIQVHQECIEKWYKNVDYGKILNRGNLCCPYCKRPSKCDQNVFFNDDNEICEVLKIMDKNPNWLHIICPSCYDVKKIVEESCGAQYNNNHSIVCDDCTEKSYKECPECNVMIDKVGGCAHVECDVCNTHFCWICLEIYDPDEIYDHIDKNHRNVTDYNSSYAHYYEMVESRLISIRDIPERFLTEDMIKLLIEIDPVSKVYFMEQTEEECIQAIKSTPRAIFYLKNPTREMYEIAVKCEWGIILCAPRQDHELCLALVKMNGNLLRYITDKTEDICLVALETNAQALQYIENQTEELCLLAVKRDGMALEFVHRQSAKICTTAVAQNKKAVKFVNYKFKHLFEPAKQKLTMF